MIYSKICECGSNTHFKISSMFCILNPNNPLFVPAEKSILNNTKFSKCGSYTHRRISYRFCPLNPLLQSNANLDHDNDINNNEITFSHPSNTTTKK